MNKIAPISETEERRSSFESPADPLVSKERMAALARYEILDTPHEQGFDGLARLAAEICGTPVGLITFVDDQRQFFKAAAGFAGDRVSPLEVGFCPQVVRDRAPVTITDTLSDPRHAGNAAAIDGGVRFYAGVPLVTSDEHVLGTLCVLDMQPRTVDLTARQRQSLEDLAGQVVSQLELRRSEAVARRERARAEKHAQRLSLIADTSRLLLAARDPVATVKDLFDILRRGFNVDVGFHFRCSEGTVGLVAALGLTEEQESSAVRLEFGQVVCGIVAERREPMHVTGIQSSDVELFRPLKGLGLESYFSTPLLAGGELLGTISFGRRDKDFSPGEIEALQTITSQLALSLDRQHAENELRESEVRRTAALAASRLGAFEWDPNTGAVTLDDRSRAIFGFAAGENVRDGAVFERIHPEDVASIRASALAAIETRSRLEASYRIVRPDGVVRAVDSLSDFMFGSEPDGGRMVGVFADVTERKRSEDALRQSERELRFALKAGRFGAWTLDLATGELTTSEMCRVNFGRNPDAPFTYAHLRDAIHSDDRERMNAAVQESIATGADYDIEYRIITPTGEMRWVLIRAQPSFDAEGAPKKMTGVSIDVTDRKRDEAQIRELNETLEQRVAERTAERNRVWEGSRDILVVTDRNGVFRDVNPAWVRILGHAPEDVIGRSFIDFVWPDDHRASAQALEAAGSGIDVDGFENRYRGQDGTPRWISWRTVFEGDLIYGYGRDVTADKQRAAELALAQEALRQSQKMEAIGQLTGGVAHDFNNLLTIIRSSTELLQRPNLAEDRRKRYVDAISDTVDRASKLTGQLLAFARRQALKPEVFDVGTRLRSVTDMLATIVGSRIQIERHVPREPCFIEADVSQFEIALINLAVNARDAMNGEGLLELVVRPAAAPPNSEAPEDDACFIAMTMSDTGSGIPKDKIARIFEPFFTTKALGKGTGLGLSQVFGFAKQSGGHVTVDSEVGHGTRFTLYLPRAEASAATAPDTLEAPGGGDGEGRRVLVVEDNVDVGTFSTQLLQDLGYETTWAAGADEALTILVERSREFDAVFSDVVMPGMNGLDLGREIRRLYPSLPVVLTSGYSDVLADDTRHGFELLHKPYAIENLSKTLRKVTGNKRQRRGSRGE